jgi:hypothetical protein
MTLRLTRRKLLIAGGLGLPLLAGGSLALLNQLPADIQEVSSDLREALPWVPKSPTNRLVLDGRASFWAGVNYPWKTGQDFGTGGWGHSGVSDPTTYQEVDADFANMAAQGVRVVKWRVFSDGRYSPEFAGDGTVTGLDEFFFKDLDAALEIAQRHDVYLAFTLFASGLWTADCESNGVHLGGHANTLLDPSRRKSLVEQGVVPMLLHLRGSDRVLAFEIIAEPEWGIQELTQAADRRIKVPLEALRGLIGDVTKAIHQHMPDALAGVESNRSSNAHVWKGLGLDYYSFSWYDWLEPYDPLNTAAATLKLDRPVLIGEFPASGSAYYQLPQVLDQAYAQGYAGAFAWSYWSGDGLSQWRNVAPSYTDWVRERWDEVDPKGAASPPPQGPVVEQPYPYTYQDFSTNLDGDGAIVAEMKIKVTSGEPYVPHAYLYEIGDPQPLRDVRLTAAPGQPGRLAARFEQAETGTPYAISLGIFDRAGKLRKWFNNVATLAVVDGQVTTPKVDTLTTELGCGS